MAIRTCDAPRRPHRRGCHFRNPLPPRPADRQVNPQYLIVDADDTLWENNIYFERAFAEFVEFLAHSSLSPAEVRDVLDEIELTNARIHGYGSLVIEGVPETLLYLAGRHHLTLFTKGHPEVQRL